MTRDLRTLPKAHLHLHFTGSMRHSTLVELADEHGWDEVVVVTSDFHTARSRLLFRQCLGDRVAVVGASREGSVGFRQQLTEVAGIVVGATIRRAC